MLAAAGSIFGLFLLSSLYLQNVLGMGPLSTGLAFIPLALAAGVGAHASGHIIASTASVARWPRAFLIAAAGMTCSPTSARTAATSATSCPACSSPGSVSASPSSPSRSPILTGARDDETGMISGLNSTGHEIGGTIGIAIFSTIAAGAARSPARTQRGIAHAFVAAGVLATVAASSLSPSCRGRATSCRSCG